MTAVSATRSILPATAAQNAPAAAVSMGAAGPAPSSGAPPGAPLALPAGFRERLDTAVSEGVADAIAFMREHSRSERWMVPDWAMLRMKWPPKDDKPELAVLHEIARERTPEGIERARYWAKHGLTDEWLAMIEEYARRASPADARAARKLMNDVLMMVNTITQTAKAGAARQRPFAVDPTLSLAVDKPGNNPSYPSGHTTAAIAASLVLSHLMPDRRDEFMGNAREASWARVYAGVHFPSDVVAGAKLAATVASYMIRTTPIKPMRGTRNPGVAGAHQALQGATHLPGPRLERSPAAGIIGAGQPGAAAMATGGAERPAR